MKGVSVRARLAVLAGAASVVVASVAVPIVGSPAGDDRPGFAGDFVVRFAPGSAGSEQRLALERLGLALVRRVPHTGFARVRPRGGVPVRASDVLRQPAIAAADPLVRYRSSSKVEAPDDPRFADQWNLRMMQIPEAWNISTGVGATVAVLDSGVAYEDYDDGEYAYRKSPGFSRTRFVPGYDFVDDDPHPNDNLLEVGPGRPGHGTYIAGVIAESANDDFGSAGVAPGAAIMPVRVLDRSGGGDDVSFAAGLMFAADHGADVVNMSFSGTDSGPAEAAVRYAAAKGVTMVAASGNGRVGAPEVDYPAAYPEVIAVGAVRKDKTRAFYADYGDALDISAPGGDLYADPRDGGIRQTSFRNTLDGFCSCTFDGTSAAAPHVAGAAALLVASGLARTPDQIRRALSSSALDLGVPGPDREYGAGLVRARSALAAAAAASADLSVSVAASGAGPATSPDAPVSYKVTVSNAGPAAATGVVVTLKPPVDLDAAVTSQVPCTGSGSSVACGLETLQAGASATLTVEAPPLVPVATVGEAVTVSGNEGDGDAADNTGGGARNANSVTPAEVQRRALGPVDQDSPPWTVALPVAAAVLGLGCAGIGWAVRARRRERRAPDRQQPPSRRARRLDR